MSAPSSSLPMRPGLAGFIQWGSLWLVLLVLAAGVFFAPGSAALLAAWSTPEYSHGPLIPLLSALLFLRQLKEYPPQPGPKSDRWPGLAVIVLSLLLGTLGRLANIDDIVAYAMILWVGGVLLVSFGWHTGRHFWPPVLHLVYMLPLPGVLYYKLSTLLQFMSSELGVWFLGLLNVPVFLDGNIIDLGVTKLHVAEACSGLRYLFPILSFSYIFAVLYRGPVWHKAILLISAAPITMLMNSIRIAVAGYIVNRWGLDWVEGFTHFFEGWVIFLISVALMFLLAWLLLRLQRSPMSLSEALDLDTTGLGDQLMRLRYVFPSPALIAATALMLLGAAGLALLPERGAETVARQSFSSFPRQIGDWQQDGPRQFLDLKIEQSLGADDYLQINLRQPEQPVPVGLFIAWYADQSKGGVHSPEICLPSSGWEIAWLERSDIAAEMGQDSRFDINRAIIQKGETQMMVFYWFQQKNRRIAWDFAAKFWLMVDGVTTGRTDGALVRLTTIITRDETPEDAENRLLDALKSVNPRLAKHIPET